jgi:trk system potassium uptake protein TrkA
MGEFLIFVNPEVKLPKKIIIYGATITGTHVAMKLVGKVQDLLLIEEDPKVATDVAESLEGVRIINGSASDQDILTECGIEVADVFIATSNNDHSNLISSVLAKKMGAKTTIITTQQQDFMAIVDSLDIDAVINPYHLAVEQILRLVRGKGISAVTKLLEGKTEALEFIPQENSPITKGPLKTIKFPKNSIVGAVYSENEVVLANGDVQIKAGERVIVFCHETDVKKLQALFTYKNHN